MATETSRPAGSPDRGIFLERVRRARETLYDLYNDASWMFPNDQARMLLHAARTVSAFHAETILRKDRQSTLPLRMPKSLAFEGDEQGARDDGAEAD